MKESRKPPRSTTTHPYVTGETGAPAACGFRKRHLEHAAQSIIFVKRGSFVLCSALLFSSPLCFYSAPLCSVLPVPRALGSPRAPDLFRPISGLPKGANLSFFSCFFSFFFTPRFRLTRPSSVAHRPPARHPSLFPLNSPFYSRLGAMKGEQSSWMSRMHDG
ncbi:hypothetical protein BZA05DRAFT_409810 [Tricharina praecox]|uniref:uncharacterized protein n=1 Tax=Tricharina praecox TaxID=43433 RepID=UPI002220AD54|nr:uncharacterized protein BZA05DRAFT_409810 [Tricharina praecox]KAI5844342.1 hypothetical protein BZA05DRAFT_409810 [Tricharina praecox]